MPESHPDRILVRAAVEHDLPADRAEVELIVSGSSFFSGSSALARAKEVRDVVGTLTELGVPADDVSLLDVVAESSKGLITTTSSATYTLKVVVRQLDRLADVQIESTRHKHTKLGDVVWKYPDIDPLEDEWLATAMRRAKAKATIIAEALGVGLGTVHLAEFDRIEEGRPMPMASERALVRGRVESVGEVLGMGVVHTRRAGVRVRVEYRLRGS